jgi:hypothetical protein
MTALGKHRKAEGPLRARSIEFTGLAIGLACGLLVALTWLAIKGSSGPGRQNVPGPVTIGKAQSSGPDPAALDAQWAAYSNRSTCADWAGGDGVSAVSLGPGQIAWFFSDTYLGPAGPAVGFSRISGFVHNSVVVQTTTGKGSRLVTLTGGGACAAPGRVLGPPASVVSPPQAPGNPDERYWDEDGLRVGGTVVKFYNRYLPGGVPFVPTGTVMASFAAAQLSSAGRGPAYGAVARPRLIPLPSYTPPGASSPIVWGAALLRAGNTVYVYGTQTPATPVPDRQLYLARVPAAQLTQFAAWRFYAGGGRWATGQPDARPVQPASTRGLTVSSGFSVVKAGPKYWLIQADPLVGSNDIDAYPASAPWGPFDPAAGVVLYRNVDVGLDAAHDYRIMYEARAEPALSTARTLVISYNVNSLAVTAGCVPMSAFTNTVTQPRFITVPLALLASGSAAGLAGGSAAGLAGGSAAGLAGGSAAGSGGGPAAHPAGAVRAGPSNYPRVVPKQPAQWFDEWKYPGGCPPVPAVTRVQARPKSGAVTLSWPDAGLGVRYQVSVQGVTGNVRQVTVRSPGATVTGLHPGTYLARVVPANAKHDTGRAAQVTFTIP